MLDTTTTTTSKSPTIGKIDLITINLSKLELTPMCIY